MDVRDISDKLVEMQKYADSIGYECDTIKMYQCFYEQHKEINGSYKNAEDYDKKMKQRFEWIFRNMETVIKYGKEFRLNYWTKKPSPVYRHGEYINKTQNKQRDVVKNEEVYNI